MSVRFECIRPEIQYPYSAFERVSYRTKSLKSARCRPFHTLKNYMNTHTAVFCHLPSRWAGLQPMAERETSFRDRSSPWRFNGGTDRKRAGFCDQILLMHCLSKRKLIAASRNRHSQVSRLSVPTTYMAGICALHRDLP
jgi:hypothetical protein